MIWNVWSFLPKQTLQLALPYSSFVGQVAGGNVSQVRIVRDDITGTLVQAIVWPEPAKAKADATKAGGIQARRGAEAIDLFNLSHGVPERGRRRLAHASVGIDLDGAPPAVLWGSGVASTRVKMRSYRLSWSRPPHWLPIEAFPQERERRSLRNGTVSGRLCIASLGRVIVCLVGFHLPRHARVRHRSRGYAQAWQDPPLQNDPPTQDATFAVLPFTPRRLPRARPTLAAGVRPPPLRPPVARDWRRQSRARRAAPWPRPRSARWPFRRR